jgi:hypothetical protein
MEKDKDDERFEEMLESYTMVPPSPHVLKRKKKISIKERVQHGKTKKKESNENK